MHPCPDVHQDDKRSQVSGDSEVVRPSKVEAVADVLEMNNMHCIVDTLEAEVKMGISGDPTGYTRLQ